MITPSHSPPPALPPPLHAQARNTVADTWRWLWKDSAGRILPFALAAAAYARFSEQGARGVGMTREGLKRDVIVGNAVGLPAAAVAIAFRRWVAPGYRLPTAADQALQTAFYFGLNAPVEELFWRGTVQNLTIAGLRRVPVSGIRRAAGPLGWAAATAVFGVYHRLGGWSWRSIAGVTVAGGLFGALYLRSRRRSLLPAIIVHGYMTAGFLSWGDLALHLLRLRAASRQTRTKEHHMSEPRDDEQYARAIEDERRQKDAAFRAVPQSPIPAAERASFAGLVYYAPDTAFRVQAMLEPFERPEVVLLGSTKGDVRPQLRFGTLRFTLAGQEYRLTGYKDAGDPDAGELFVPFRDATTGGETYGAGRYLETEDPGGGLEPRTVMLDFNLAYSPWCAYNADFSCTLPPPENALPVAVAAGEKTYGADH